MRAVLADSSSALCRNVVWVLQDSSVGGRATGRFSVADFVSSDFVKDGSWLGSPEAVRGWCIALRCRVHKILQRWAINIAQLL